jgi:hypothetical protein
MSNDTKSHSNPSIIVLIIIVLVAIAVVFFEFAPNAAAFKLESKDIILEALLGLFVAALLMERVQEVFITAWRDMGSQKLNALLKSSENYPELNPSGDAPNEILRAEQNLSVYKKKTKNMALGLGLLIGFVFALIGVRSLSAMMEYENLVGVQAGLFNIFDLVITAGVIAGGSDAIHKLVSVFTDGFDSTRAMIKNRAKSGADNMVAGGN